MEATKIDSFPQFARLYPELRVLIWEFYFTAPRIHLIQQALPHEVPPQRASSEDKKAKAKAGNFLTWITFDTGTNQRVSGCLRTDINQEARSVAKKVGLRKTIKREMLRDEERWRAFDDAYITTIIKQKRVDVDWANDLFYVFDPKSLMPLLGIGRSIFSRNIQHLAFAVPWQCPAPNKVSQRLGLSFQCHWLAKAPKHFEQIKTITVVTLPPGEASERHTKAIPSSICSRDAYGFTSVKKYHKHSTFQYSSSTIIQDTRIAIGARRDFNIHHRKSKAKPVVVRAVDVDFISSKDGKYERRVKVY